MEVENHGRSDVIPNNPVDSSETAPPAPDVSDLLIDPPIELEEYAWKLYQESGLYAQIREQIVEFLQNSNRLRNSSIIPNRADAEILGSIYEYLDWVGMRRSATMIAAESPVDFPNRGNSMDLDEPKLTKLFRKTDSEKIDKPNASKTFLVEQVQERGSETNLLIGKEQEELLPLPRSRDEHGTVEMNVVDESKVSQIVPEESDFKSADVPVEPNQNEEQESVQYSEPIVPEDRSLGGVQEDEEPSKTSYSESFDNDPELEAYQTQDPDKSNPAESSMNKMNEESLENKDVGQHMNSSEKVTGADDSLSDLLDNLTASDNTEDISINSDSKGITSCEHGVDLE